MFEQFPVAIDALKGSTDAARLVDAAVDWAKVGAAADAQRFALIAEFATLALADAGDDTCLWWVDEEDDVVAEIGAAFGISRRWAMADLEIGAAMRERFPRLAELFHRGEISAKVMATVVDRTLLVTDPDALAAIDAACVEAAVLCGWSGLSYYKLKNAIDVWVHRHDPTAVRRARDKVRDRSYTVRADQDGTSSVCIQMSTPGAALLTGRLRKMAKAVCKDDPRTLDQRMVDALEALAVDANHLKCLCGSPTCPATAEDGVASRYLVHIYAEAGALDVEPDPLIHGDDPRDQPPRPAGNPARTTTANPTAAPTSDTDEAAEPTEPVAAAGEPAAAAEPAELAVAEGGPADSAVAEGEPAVAAESAQSAGRATESDDEAAAPKPSRPPQCPAPAPAAESEPEPQRTTAPAPTTESEPEPQRAAAPTAAPATPTPRVCPPTGVIPGYGIVTAPLLAALLAGGAEVRHMKAPAVDPEDHYRPSTTLADFLRGRDLTCRFPGCDTPIDEADLDHTVPWADGGPTHASDLKGYCRHHHLIKTFRDGWSEIQKPDGTLILTSPIGRTYTSVPTSRLLFPTIDTTSAPLQRGSPRTKTADDTTATMPKRKQSKAHERAYRINAERARNAAHLATQRAQQPPPRPPLIPPPPPKPPPPAPL